MMLSKQLTNVVQNLEKKKFREKYNLFLVEGGKLVDELITSGITVNRLIARESWLNERENDIGAIQCVQVTEREMQRLSNFKSLPEVIALAEIPSYEWKKEEVVRSLSLVLNGIQDPGNLGTILRTCDWFGVERVFCDRDTVSAFNPKTVQASMGAVFRTKVFYLDLPQLLQQLVSPEFPCWGTYLEGEDIYTGTLAPQGLIVLGNEGGGISEEVGQWVSRRLTIPRIPRREQGAESLNVGVAAGIVLSEFRRREQYKEK